MNMPLANPTAQCAVTAPRVRLARAASRPGWSRTTRCRWSSLEFAFRGGAAQDPAGKAGVATLLAGLLDEGAGDLDCQAFHARARR